jgi:hypothetical protein
LRSGRTASLALTTSKRCGEQGTRMPSATALHAHHLAFDDSQAMNLVRA